MPTAGEEDFLEEITEEAPEGEELNTFHENMIKSLDFLVNSIFSTLARMANRQTGTALLSGGIIPSRLTTSNSRYSKRSRTPSAMN